MIYPFDLIVFFGGTYTEIEVYLKDVLPEYIHTEINTLDRNSSGRTVMFSSGQTVIKLKNKPTHGVIAHEIFHAVEFLFNRLGSKLTLSSDEAYAYMIEYITNEIYKKSWN